MHAEYLTRKGGKRHKLGETPYAGSKRVCRGKYQVKKKPGDRAVR